MVELAENGGTVDDDVLKVPVLSPEVDEMLLEDEVCNVDGIELVLELLVTLYVGTE